jgi:hypothetical protein
MSFDLKLESGDLKISNSNHDLVTVTDTEKLVQDILKIISTPIGGNPFFPWYGSPISSSLVGTAFDTVFIANMASVQLKNSVETLQNLQKTQLNYSQIVTPQEQIAAVQNVNINRNSNDPRFFSIVLTVLSKAFRQVPISLQIRP